MSEREDLRGHRGNYFARPGFFDCDVATGVMKGPTGRRVIALTDDFLVGFSEALRDECGPAAEVVLRTCGRTYGEGFARELERGLSEHHARPLRELEMALFQACLAEAFSRYGLGLLRLDLAHHGEGTLAVEVRNTIFSRMTKERVAVPSDHLLAGMLAGVFSHFAGRPLECVQTEEQAAGAPASRFVLGLAERLAKVADNAKAGEGHDRVVAQLAKVRA